MAPLSPVTYNYLPVAKEISFKDISYLELWQPFCSAEGIHLCNFGSECYEEQICEIILILGQWFRRRCHLKNFLSGALAALLLSRAGLLVQF